MANNVVNIYKFGDFKVSPVGDLILDNGSPVVINGSELLHQEYAFYLKTSSTLITILDILLMVKKVQF